MKKLAVLVIAAIALVSVLILAQITWGAEKKEAKPQTAKIVVDVADQTGQKAVVVETTRKAKPISMINSAQAKRLRK